MNTRSKIKNTIWLTGLIILSTTSCTDSFLKPQPLSFLDVTNTYNTIQGLESGLNQCRKGLIKDFMLGGGFLQIDYVGTDLATACCPCLRMRISGEGAVCRGRSLLSRLLLPAPALVF